MKLLTDTELRKRWFADQVKDVWIDADTRLTPAAKDFLHEQGIRLHYGVQSGMPVMDNSKKQYINDKTGAILREKPEEMTHLKGNRLVNKTDPRIAFRGQLDSLRAELICLQVLTEKEAKTLTTPLQELIDALGNVMAADVRGVPVKEMTFFGMPLEEIHRTTHNPHRMGLAAHPVPEYSMGEVCAQLNRIRALTRQAELSAITAYGQDSPNPRPDICLWMNRLSSCVYYLFCHTAVTWKEEQNG